ncbi:putative TetR family transcriptional regulator [Gordonia araii NBRC 100433]|uniref:Putative TetR family transcriptional regulator n=1 Tax=Gordonia araii NBRC 100433 TaxID=1073574 RepID=G7H184_9ACTN|nr:TetR/AcrR family transcriptional regulator [Gordonia araii]NNG96768.1 TetR/AcrR family transcriptional regulator [Gordonia araii NBRC 100433]GAB09544.1 putative TetR family transcriptional regulator [Gordonia araii NBRC 100433]
MGDPSTTRPLVPRRRPTQERSRRKFETMLAVARELLIDVGFESMTCEEIAARSDVPIGTLYQFFANKYVIVCELDRQDTVAVQAELAELGSAIPSLDWVNLLDRFLDHLAALWQHDPSRRAVWLAVQSTPATRATAALNEQALAEQVEHILAPLTPHQRERRATMARLLVHTAYSALSFSVQVGEDHEAVVAELKRLLGGYLLREEDKLTR